MRTLAIFDTGKTSSRLSIYRGAERCAQWSCETPHNREAKPYSSIDVSALEVWLLKALEKAAKAFEIDAIVPAAHGATLALMTAQGELLAPVLDYEAQPPGDIAAAYESLRPPFSETGSPSLPAGLNLGRQLAWLEALGVLETASVIVTYPQYWAARLSGIMASEITTLGCHTDLWAPASGTFSSLARQKGWDKKFAPLRSADEKLGRVLPDIAERCGLSRTCVVYCGLHDSNAALVGLRHGLQPDGQTAFISTGTWHVTMAPGAATKDLPARRDTLINIASTGEPIPSARFMGGRDFRLICGETQASVTDNSINAVLEQQLMALPSLSDSGGPFQAHRGTIDPAPERLRSTIATLYLALMWRTELDLLVPNDPLERVILEGPAATEAAAGLLATLVPDAEVMIAPPELTTAYGAVCLVEKSTLRARALRHIPSKYGNGLRIYRAKWSERVSAANTNV